MSIVKIFAHDWLPPVIASWIRYIRTNHISFEGGFPSWELASRQCTGYSSYLIFEKVLAATLKVKVGDALFERDSVLFYEVDYIWPVISGLMWAAAQNGGRLNVLDFGGALGSCYFQHQAILKSLPDVKWSVVEQLHYVDAGRAHIQDEVLQFYPSIEDCLSENRPNVILLSSVLQYLSDPTYILHALADINADVLIIDKTIVNSSDSDRIYIQHVPDSIYKASYPCWSLSESKLIDVLSNYYNFIIDFPSLNFPALNSINSEFKGYIFQRSLS
jgi:putative methyltransferase (TIGR04325 family)